MTTATCDHITRADALSEQETLRQNLARFINGLTDNGNRLAQFMWDVVQGEYPEAKLHHRQIAARDLAVMSGKMPEDTPGSAARVVRVSEDAGKPKSKPKITMKEIANWDMGRLIRAQTDDCRTLALSLYKLIDDPYVFESANKAERKYQKATRIRPHHQVSAAQELLKRGAGSPNPHCYAQTSSMEERMLHSQLSRDIREITDDGIDLVRFLFDVIDNPKQNRWGEIIEDPYTQTHRLWAIKHLLWRGVDIPWEHITPDDIEQYYRDLTERERREADRRRAERKTSAQLTPEQEAEVLAIFEQSQRKLDQSAAKAAAKAAKKAKKASKKADAAKKATLDAANKNTGSDESVANDNNGNDNGSAAASNDKDAANGNNTGKDTGAANSAHVPDTPTTRGETAIANALARHPEVDLDTALENHHSTAGIPKQNLTHAQIYDAITAEANFQKRQAIIQNRLRAKNPDAPGDSGDPNARSP